MQSAELKTFLAVAEHNSISAAARQLHLTQPAVSKRIQTLEAQLGGRLFDRIGKRLQLNQAGKLLVPQARQMLAIWADTQRQLTNLVDQVSGTLHLATSHHIGLHRLAPVLEEFRRTYPDVMLNIAFEDSEVTHKLVREGGIELAVATLDPEGSHSLALQPIWNDPLIFVDRSLQQATLASLAQRACVLPGSSTYTGRIVSQCFEAAGVRLQPGMSTNYLETIHMLVGVGVGWSVLPRTMQGDLQAVKVAGVALNRQLGVITNPQRILSNAAQAFLQVLHSYADPELVKDAMP